MDRKKYFNRQFKGDKEVDEEKWIALDAPPNSWIDSTVSPKVKNNRRTRNWGTFHGSQHFKGRGPCWSSGMGLGRMTSMSIIHMDLHNPNNKLVSAQLEHFWCISEPWANIDSQDSPWPGFGGNHHFLPYIILCAWPQG